MSAAADTCRICGADLHAAAEIAVGECAECHAEDDDSVDMEYRACTACESGPFWLREDDERCHLCRDDPAYDSPASSGVTTSDEDVIDEREQRANERAEREEYDGQVAEDRYLDSMEVTW